MVGKAGLAKAARPRWSAIPLRRARRSLQLQWLEPRGAAVHHFHFARVLDELLGDQELIKHVPGAREKIGAGIVALHEGPHEI